MSKNTNPPVTVIGLGQLGTALAEAFLAHGHPTTVWNRSAGKADALIGGGAVLAGSVAEAVAASPLVVVCVTDYDAVRGLLDPVGEDLAGRVLVNLTSGTPELAREMATWSTGLGADYLDGAAMSGTRSVGRPDALFLFSGAAANPPVLASLGTATHLGADPGLASLYDTALFGLIWGALSGFYHATSLLGADNLAAFASVAAGHLPFVGGLLTEHAGQILAGRYPDDDGTVRVHAAAMDHLVHTSRAAGVSADVPEFFGALLARAVAAGHGDEGIASVAAAIRMA